MSHDLHGRLDDLASDAPVHVVRDGLADRAWAAGRRRRTRRRLVGAGAAVAVLGVLWLTLTPVLDTARPVGPAAAGSRTRVDGYPARIGWPWLLRGLPGAPGPIAGVAERDTAHDWSWLAVSPGGRVWRVPSRIHGADTMPMLSPDGTRLGYLAADAGPYVVQDLTTGRRTTFPEVGGALAVVRTRYLVGPQTPGFWSPDGRRLLLAGGSRGERGPFGALVLDAEGGVRLVPTDMTPVGWLSDTELGWLTWHGRGASGVATSATLVVTDLAGRTIRTVPLDVDARMGLAPDQWTGSLAPDKRGLALVDQETNFGGDGRIRVFSTADGSQVGEFHPPSVTGVCPTSWQGSTPVVPTSRATGAALWSATRTPRPLTVSDPAAGIRCLVLADDALAGGAHRGLFGTATSWWTWHATDLALGLLGAAAALVGVFTLRRRAAANRPPSGFAPTDPIR